MSFFGTSCSEIARNEEEFGLCDGQGLNRAFSTIHDPALWVAVVKNPTRGTITFTALDHCLDFRKNDTNDQESLCDGMLTFDNGLFLVELKAWRSSGWMSKAESQLRNSIALLREQHDVSTFRLRKACICNKRRPNFHVIETARKRAFFDETGFRLDVNTTIAIS